MSGRNAASIGVLDSGIGGLSVLAQIHNQLPNYRTLYIADQAHLPYGPRSAAEIDRYVEGMTRFLMERGAAVIVLACHAASAASLEKLRQRYPGTPFVGIEPAIKPAVERTRTGVIGVLTTQATADGPLYQRGLARFGGSARIITRVAPELVLLAEQTTPRAPNDDALLREAVEPLVAAGADQIVLACTHFPFLADAIQQIAGPTVTLVDPGPAVARQVARVWPADATPGDKPDQYFTTGHPSAFRAALQHFIHVSATVTPLRWDETAGVVHSDPAAD